MAVRVSPTMSGDGPKRVSKFANYDAFGAVDAIVSKKINTSDEQDSWNRFAASNKGRHGVRRTVGYTESRHAPAFPKLGHWQSDPSGINDGRWKANNDKLVQAAEENRRKKIWEDEQRAAKEAAKENAKRPASEITSDATEGASGTQESGVTNSDAPASKKVRKAGSKDVFLKIIVDGRPAGVMQFRLFDDVVPKTAENFRALCVGNKYVLWCSDLYLVLPDS